MTKKIKSLNDVGSIYNYLTRIGAEARSLRTAVVKQSFGLYWKDLATIRFDREGNIEAPEQYMPTALEEDAIRRDLVSVTWPEQITLKRLPSSGLPKEITEAEPKHIFEFRDLAGDIVLVQVKIPNEDPSKRSYIPFTYWDDGEWRKMEPEGKLPLWGLDQLTEGNHTRIFLHEGAKAARHCRWMVEGKTPDAREALKAFPWADEISGAAHLGWIGGALSPSRTDWSVLAKQGVKRVYIVSDNDTPGLMAVPHIAYHLRCATFHVQFTSEWKPSFDLADPWPDDMFEMIEGKRYYKGPSFRSCLHPATWATDLVPQERRKPLVVLRDNFKEMWAYVEDADLFVCIEMPEIVRTEPVVNKMLSGFSHTQACGALIAKNYRGRNTKLTYRPDISGRIVSDRETSAINLHMPTHVKSVEGNPKPFLDFMEYLIPDPEERHQTYRWCATLIACPHVKMEYGLLMVSEQQGVGKTTLGSIILSPLVGRSNTGFPSESDIVENKFNDWIASKRLVVVNEIYSGHSWKAYQKLKSAITDKHVAVNQKYQRTYLIENWAHMFACSNSLAALKMEETDRRWYYPELTETKWGMENFRNFHRWLESGGLGIIKKWAEDFGDYVLVGEAAPMTKRKRALIEESRSEGQKAAADLAVRMNEMEEPVAVTMLSVDGWVKQQVGTRTYDTQLELRKAMKEAGIKTTKEPIKVVGRKQHVLFNTAMYNQIRGTSETIATKLLRDAIKDPQSILEGRF